MRLAWLCCALVGCGRIGFEPSTSDDGAVACMDGGPRADGGAFEDAQVTMDGASEDGFFGVDARSIDAPASTDGGTDGPDGTAPNRAFVTSTTYTGNLGGIAGADAICRAHAEMAGLEGTFVAWLSTDGVPEPFASSAWSGWVDLSGVPLADSPQSFYDGTMFHALRRNENNVETGDQPIWLGSLSGGPNCRDWTSDSSADEALVGSTWRSFRTFTRGGCSTARSLVCLETGRVAPSLVSPVAGRIAFSTRAFFVPGGGLADADALCAMEAANAGLSGSFLAALATSTADRFARFDVSGPVWTRVDGIPLAADAAELITGAPLLDSFVIPALPGAVDLPTVWSGTRTESCDEWTNATTTANGATGRTTTVERTRWNLASVPTCNLIGAVLLCLEQ